ncbi:MAG: serine/threonine protein kinase [Quisquiliibacterium sp.]
MHTANEDHSDSAPYGTLTPDLLLDAIESVGERCDGRILQLNSFENRVFQVGLDAGQFIVAKFYRPNRWTDAQILEEHRFTTELAEHEVPVVAPVQRLGSTLHRFAEFRFALYPRRGGRAPELDDAATLEWTGRFIGRIHALGMRASFVERPSLDLQSFGVEPVAWLRQHSCVAEALRPAWDAVVDQALEATRRAFEECAAVSKIRLHGDCHPGNILWTDAGPHFVDFDDARSGPAIQDLWMLLSGDRHEMSRQLGDLLAGYEDFAEFDRRELRLLEPLRTLRLIHYSAWIARRWNDPAFPAAFPWFGTERYWQDRILELREQLGAISEEPLRV